MTGAAFLLLSVLLGMVVESYFAFSENLWVKFSFATIVGTVVSTWFIFVLSYFVGFNQYCLIFGIAAMAAVVAYSHKRLSLRGTTFKMSFTQAMIIAAIVPFFVFGVWQTPEGGINFHGNYSDMSYHMSMVSYFAANMGFPPRNPQSAGDPLIYHILVDFHSSILYLGGMKLLWSVVIPGIMYAFAFANLLWHFYKILLEKEGKVLFSALFFIEGHIGVFNLIFAFAGFPAAGTTFHVLSWPGIREQMLFPFLNFLDIIINYFQPQRPFLFGFPLALIILSSLYEVLVRQEEIDQRKLFTTALFTGLMPLFHVHSFLVVCPVVCLVSFYVCPERKTTITALSPILLGVVQILWIMSQPKLSYYSGFDVHRLGGGLEEMKILNSVLIARLLFWIRAAGAPLLFGTASAYLYFRRHRDFSFISGSKNIYLMVFLGVGFLYFVTINFYRFTPSWGDSNKFFLYFALCLSVFTGDIAWSFFGRGGVGAKAAVIGLIMVSGTLPSAIENYSILTRPSEVLFTPCDVKAANWIKKNTPAGAVFLTANGVVHFVAPLAGRAVVDGAYNREVGYEKPGRQEDIRNIYATADPGLIRLYKIDYIVISRYERNSYTVNENALMRYKKVYDETCEGENYKIYDTR